MNETAQDARNRRHARHARIDALTGDQRRFLLDFLVGYAPEAADTALDDLEAARQQMQPHGYDPDSHVPGNSCTYCGRYQDDPLHAAAGEG